MLKSLCTMALGLSLVACSSDDDVSNPSVEEFVTVSYEYNWPDDLEGYKIRLTDTEFNKDHRLFQEFLQDGYSHAFVLDFTITGGDQEFEIYGYEDDNAKYSSDGYHIVSTTVLDFADGISEDYETISLYTDYTYTDNGVDLEGGDHYTFYPTSATGGTYMSWGTYPGSNSLYDAKTGVYEIVVDPTS